ncbi:AAA family ATPase [Enterococcus lactis]|uniref:AAA family ATPase n=1 Tax=Enterococcus lactis TaxID=357441 RepID=UPI001CDB6C62|nr:AAA family ATPase [Enterococcus lactis]UBX37861.1 AAA family ATPase [Enterococcus lactis]
MVKKIKAEDLSVEKGTYMIYANPGMGKTYSLGFLPGKSLILDVDGSSSTLAKHPNKENIEVWELDSSDIWQEWLDTISDLVANKSSYEKQFDNICVDNISELFKAQLEDLGKKGKNSGVPSQADYQRTDFMNLRGLRALNNLDCRIVLTAWETTDTYTEPNGQFFTRSMPDIRSKILNNFLGLCDVVGRLVIKKDDDGNETRGLILKPTSNIYAKNRLDERSGCLVEQLVVRAGGEPNVSTPTVSD